MDAGSDMKIKRIEIMDKKTVVAKTPEVSKCASTPRLIGHFTVVCSVTWPLNGSEAGVDLVLIQTLLLLFCKSSCSDAN